MHDRQRARKKNALAVAPRRDQPLPAEDAELLRERGLMYIEHFRDA